MFLQVVVARVLDDPFADLERQIHDSEAHPRAARRLAPKRERAASRRAPRKRLRRRDAARSRGARASPDRIAARRRGDGARAEARRAPRVRRQTLPGPPSEAARVRSLVRTDARPPACERAAVPPRALPEGASRPHRALGARLCLRLLTVVRECHGQPPHAFDRAVAHSAGSPGSQARSTQGVDATLATPSPRASYAAATV